MHIFSSLIFPLCNDKERKLFKGGNYMRKYGICNFQAYMNSKKNSCRGNYMRKYGNCCGNYWRGKLFKGGNYSLKYGNIRSVLTLSTVDLTLAKKGSRMEGKLDFDSYDLGSLLRGKLLTIIILHKLTMVQQR